MGEVCFFLLVVQNDAPQAPPQIFHNNPGNGITILSRTESISLSSASAHATAQPPLDPVKTRSNCQNDRQSSYHLLWWMRFTRLKTLLEDEFPGELEITGEGTPSTTGWFEVEVNNQLVHSKKNGDGFVDSDIKLKAVVTAIEKAMRK
ncbi:hypothetical protein QQF64_027403 [Cirrhinus molitorella]|uniref:Uncharacterized protein n=2 Tax=Cirrhinus molitorella TaxID=172907 RepID=A0ABR3NCC0_9TELE|nr:hypothetical protein Q8A67_003735 [Cirrhinus molitorella]